TLCSPGTYQDMRQQTSCKPCPIGYQCPEEGMSYPRPCWRGYVCDREGIAIPTTLCPQAHYCLDATETTDPLNLLTDRRPYPCPNHTYCGSGVSSSITIL